MIFHLLTMACIWYFLQQTINITKMTFKFIFFILPYVAALVSLSICVAYINI